MAVNLLDFDLEGLTAFCAQLGEKPFRATQLYRWIHQKGASDFEQMSDLAKSLRGKLAAAAEVRKKSRRPSCLWNVVMIGSPSTVFVFESAPTGPHESEPSLDPSATQGLGDYVLGICRRIVGSVGCQVGNGGAEA